MSNGLRFGNVVDFDREVTTTRILVEGTHAPTHSTLNTQYSILNTSQYSAHSLIMSSLAKNRAAPVAVLLDPKSDIPLGEKNVKLDDYLNDKIQTRADFATLPSLLAKVEAQRRDLERQVGTFHSFVNSANLILHSFKMPDSSSTSQRMRPQTILLKCWSRRNYSKNNKKTCKSA